MVFPVMQRGFDSNFQDQVYALMSHKSIKAVCLIPLRKWEGGYVF